MNNVYFFKILKNKKSLYTSIQSIEKNDEERHNMWIEVVNIIGGLILCMGLLEAIPMMGKHLKKLAKWLGSFQTIIGIIAIILAIIWWTDIQSIIAIIVGLILIAGILPAIPMMGKYLEKLAKWLGSFQTIIGIIAIIIGIWGLL